MKQLEQVLADALEDVVSLRRNGHTVQAASIERLVDDVRESMRSYLTTLSESEAQMRSGWTTYRLRSRFSEWEARGLAMLDEKGRRRYREIVVPVRAEDSSARLAGQRGESLRAANG